MGGILPPLPFNSDLTRDAPNSTFQIGNKSQFGDIFATFVPSSKFPCNRFHSSSAI
jgi:hypothetical protein